MGGLFCFLGKQDKPTGVEHSMGAFFRFEASGQMIYDFCPSISKWKVRVLLLLLLLSLPLVLRSQTIDAVNYRLVF